jgi:4-amino-4-deoxy-L-arabinose transferase-like glycosyltransferase
VPLTTDEAYYWVWAQRPQLSYYDHPPFVAWLFRMGHFLEPFLSAVRWPGVILGHCILLIWILIWKNLSLNERDKPKIIWWIGLTLCSPLLGFGSLIVTPDLPVLFFWSCSILFLIRSLNSKSLWNYVFLGASLGLGFCSKYHIVLFLPILFVYLISEKKWKDVRWQGITLAILFGLLFCSPVLIWNWQNDFASFRFQLKHGLGRTEYKPYWTWTYILAQIMVLFPTVFWSALRAQLKGTARIFLYFGWGPLIFFFLSSFKGLVEVNWPIIAYPAFFAIAVLGSYRPILFKIANVFWISIFIILGSHVIRPWIPSAPDKLSEFSQFEPLLSIRNQYQPLYASTYQMASWVWYETKNPIFKLKGMSRLDLFDTFPEAIPAQFPIYIAMRRYTSMPDWIEQDSQFKVSEVASLENDLVIMRVDK